MFLSVNMFRKAAPMFKGQLVFLNHKIFSFLTDVKKQRFFLFWQDAEGFKRRVCFFIPAGMVWRPMLPA